MISIKTPIIAPNIAKKVNERLKHDTKINRLGRVIMILIISSFRRRLL